MVTLVTRVCLAEGLAGRQFNIVSPATKRSNFAPYYRYTPLLVDYEFTTFAKTGLTYFAVSCIYLHPNV
jgi:hypothetical protein